MEHDTQQQEIQDELKKIEILIRTNNLLLSRFILELDNVKRDLKIPRRQTLFRFEILDSEYKELVDEFGYKDVQTALYNLDRMLLRNKLNCPNNIARFIRNKITSKRNRQEKRNQNEA